MRIAIASSGLGNVARGIEVWAKTLAVALRQRGADVLLFKGGGQVETEMERLVPCWARHSAKTQRLLRHLPRRVFWRVGLSTPHNVEQTTFVAKLLPYLRRENVDILHVQDPLVALWVQRARRVGIVKTRAILGHGTMEPLGFLQRFEYLQHLAPWHMEEARREGVWKPSWTAIPNFVDTERFKPGDGEPLRAELGIPRNAMVLFSAAAIERRVKRIDYLIDEFATFLKKDGTPPSYLVIAGAREAATDELIRYGEERLGDRVRFLVNVPPDRMPLLYRMANLFVLCTFKEMMPVALLEACATGLPSIVNRHPVLRWAAGPSCAAIEMSIQGALSNALEKSMTDPRALGRRGCEARDYSLNNFSRDRVVDQILGYYRFVLSHDSRAARIAAAT